MAHHLHTEIEIDAAPTLVWAILTDLAAYPAWNPFITSEGTVAVGERITHRLKPPGGRPTTIKPVVTEADDGRVLEWLGRLGLPGLFDGRPRFELVPNRDRTRLIHAERFTGVLVPFLKTGLDTNTRAGVRGDERRTQVPRRSSTVR